jgi:hypothetical protein
MDIPDPKYRQLKMRAAEEGTTVTSLVMRGIDSVLSERGDRPRRRLRYPIVNMGKPGTLDIDNKRIYELIGFP